MQFVATAWGVSNCQSAWLFTACVGTNSAGGDAVTEVTYSMLLPSIAVVLFKLPDSLHITALQTVIRQSRLSDYRSCCSSGWVSVHGAVRLISWSGMKRPLHESSEML